MNYIIYIIRLIQLQYHVKKTEHNRFELGGKKITLYYYN